MKRLFNVLLAVALVLSLVACGTQRHRNSGKLQVVCTLFPYYDFVRQIGGSDVDVTLLIAAGREIHSFEPTPLDAVRLSEADVFICNGGESEIWVAELLEAVGQDIGTVLTMMEHADLLEEEIQEGMQLQGGAHDHDHEHDGHDHDKEHDVDHDEHDCDDAHAGAAYDEHIWASPVVAMALCRVIGQALIEADPAHADSYQARLSNYLLQLEALNRDFCQAVTDAHHTTLIFGDRFPLLYFCRTYGLDYRAAFQGCSGDTEPSLATLKYLIDTVKENRIPAVYTIELSSQKVARAIADSTGAKVLVFHSCQSISQEDFESGETYLTLMRRNVDALKEGLA